MDVEIMEFKDCTMIHSQLNQAFFEQLSQFLMMNKGLSHRQTLITEICQEKPFEDQFLKYRA